MTKSFDFVVVGGGSAGCVVAGELAKDPAVSVLLLEAGPHAEDHPAVLSADGYKDVFVNHHVFRDRFTVPQPEAARQRIFAGTGTVLGGSGAVNAMVYTRGAEEDYAEWPTGWRWPDVQDDFRALEAALRPSRRPPTEWTEACIRSAVEQGFRHKEDLNDGDMLNAIGYEWMNFEGDRRRNSYVAFVKDPGPRENLTVICAARAHQVVFDHGRAVGVRFEADGDLMTAHATREVILCAGALETAKLLMLSGVGPAEHLRAHDIPVLTDRPTIGENLHDHPNVPVFFKANRLIDCPYPQVYSFHRTNPQSDLPPSQSDSCFVYWPAVTAMKRMMQRIVPTKLPAAMYTPVTRQLVRGMVTAAFGVTPLERYTDRLFGIIVILGKPKSRGRLRLASTDPAKQAAVDPAYYSVAEDLETMVRGVHKARAIAAADGLGPWKPTEVLPGRRAASDQAVERYVRTNTITTYHFAGACKMGESESDPVDPQLRLRGVRGLRIADASVIPWTPVSALNAPSMLIGYRAARYAVET